MKFLLPDICVPNTYIDDLAYALEERGHEVIWGGKNLFDSEFQADVIASQWPEGYVRKTFPGGLKKLQFNHLELLQKQLEQIRQKTLILSFVHNIKSRPTGNKDVDAKREKLFQISYGAAHAFVHLGEKSIDELQTIYPASVYQGKPSLIISHGLNEKLRRSYPLLKRQLNNSEEFRIFVPGAIRFWSELNFVIQAFMDASIPNKKLVIGGQGSILEGWQIVKLLRRATVASIPGVSVFGHRLRDQALCRELIAADVIVSPRLWATNSGIPYLAATFNKRCLAPNVSNLPEAMRELKGLLFDPDDPSSLAKAMEKAYYERELVSLPNPPCPSWQEITGQIEDFILTLKSQNSLQ